jgi:hypothetical protein
MHEDNPIQISADDIAEANRLSLNCPICAGAVENNLDQDGLAPVVCAQCQTLYHQACWQQNGGKCAILGCGHNSCYPFGTDRGPLLKISYSDLPRDRPRPVPADGSKKLKAQEKRLQREVKRRTFWDSLFAAIKQAFEKWR